MKGYKAPHHTNNIIFIIFPMMYSLFYVFYVAHLAGFSPLDPQIMNSINNLKFLCLCYWCGFPSGRIVGKLVIYSHIFKCNINTLIIPKKIKWKTLSLKPYCGYFTSLHQNPWENWCRTHTPKSYKLYSYFIHAHSIHNNHIYTNK